VSPYYDSLVAKVMAHGKDRAEAIARMRGRSRCRWSKGIRTTIPLHLKVIADADYQAGKINTAFMERYLPKAPRRSRSDKLGQGPSSAVPRSVSAAAALSRSSTRARPTSPGTPSRRSPQAFVEGGARLLQIRAKLAPSAASSSRPRGRRRAGAPGPAP
jgi:acetyl/propionyl-CoA carboxylase alpha subunit